METHIQTMKPMMAPSEPYVLLKLPKLAAYQENNNEATTQNTAAVALPHVTHLHFGSRRLGPKR